MPNSPLLFSFLLFFSLLSADAIQQPKVFLHIGPHKTGTTSIQVAMKRNSIEAREEGYAFFPNLISGDQNSFANGMMFPRRGGIAPHFLQQYSQQHQLVLQHQIQQAQQESILNWVFANETQQETQQKPQQEPQQEPQQQAQQEPQQEPILNWVISSENLDFLPNRRAVERVRAFFSGYNVTIVAFVRDHLEHIRSYWLQISCYRHTFLSSFSNQLKEETKKLLEGLDEVFPGEQMFDILDIFKEVFGNESIVLVDFDGALAKPNSSLAQAFLNDVVGLKMDLTQSSAIHANERFHFMNALNMWSVLDPKKTPDCQALLPTMTALQKKFEDLNFLERCEDQADFDEISRKLESFYDEGWKSRGWEVLYKEEGDEARKKKRKKGRGDCFVVKEEHLDEAKQIGRQFIMAVGREDLVPLLKKNKNISVSVHG